MNKKRLYEQIMTSISKEVKRALNEQSYNLSIDDNDFEDDLDVRHEDEKDFDGDRLRYSIIMRDYIEEHDSFDNLNEEDYIYIESLYDKYGSQYKVRDRKELDQIVKNYKKMNKHLNWLDVSNMTDMSLLFYYRKEFNLDISKWDVSNVIDMHGMFRCADKFNQPIGDWDVSNVTDMSNMFMYETAFNQPIGDWDVSNVTDMNSMFFCAINFNQPLDKWNVSNVKDTQYMFGYANDFNQNISSWTIDRYNTNISHMFDECSISEENKPLVLLKR